MDYVSALPIDDIPTPIPANPARFIDQYRLFMRQQGKVIPPKKRMFIGRFITSDFAIKSFSGTGTAKKIT